MKVRVLDPAQTALADSPDIRSSAASDLPEGWARVNLPDVAEISMGQSPPGSTYNTRHESRDYEHASILLERIRQQSAELPWLGPEPS